MEDLLDCTKSRERFLDRVALPITPEGGADILTSTFDDRYYVLWKSLEES